MDTMLNKDYLKKLYGKISPFEFKDKLISLANMNKEKFNGTVLDAGRGNPIGFLQLLDKLFSL